MPLPGEAPLPVVLALCVSTTVFPVPPISVARGPTGGSVFVFAFTPMACAARGTLFRMRTRVIVRLVLAQVWTSRPRVPLSVAVAAMFHIMVMIVMRE